MDAVDIDRGSVAGAAGAVAAMGFDMLKTFFAAAGIAAMTAAVAQPAGGPNDAQIAHIAYTAGQIDITAAEQALAKSKDKSVRDFAEAMKRDHAAVNDKALALVKELGVTPAANPTSAALSAQAAQKQEALAKLEGKAFDAAYLANEVAFHRTVNGALASTLIPSATNTRLKGLLEVGLKLFTEHQRHAEQLEASKTKTGAVSTGHGAHLPSQKLASRSN
jgi:putative membrane protein